MTSLGALEPFPKPIYDDLLFGGWLYKSNFGFDVAQSRPNYISFSQLAKTTGASGPITNITAKYPNPKVKSYALHSCYVACAVANGGSLPPVGGVPPPSVGTPEPCTLRFSGTTSEKKAVSQDCQYSGSAANAMAQMCVFDQAKFGDVITVVVEVVSALSTAVLSAGIVDTVNHTNFYY